MGFATAQPIYWKGRSDRASTRAARKRLHRATRRFDDSGHPQPRFITGFKYFPVWLALFFAICSGVPTAMI